MKRFLIPVLLAVAVLSWLRDGGAPHGQATAMSRDNTISGRVARVTDGDTFTLSGQRRPIRVWGLDAPEWNQRGGAAATRALRDLIAGRQLTCRVRDIDRYDRIVGQCFLPDGTDITAWMIRKGVAREYCRFSGGYYGTCGRN